MGRQNSLETKALFLEYILINQPYCFFQVYECLRSIFIKKAQIKEKRKGTEENGREIKKEKKAIEWSQCRILHPQKWVSALSIPNKFPKLVAKIYGLKYGKHDKENFFFALVDSLGKNVLRELCVANSPGVAIYCVDLKLEKV